MADAPKPAERTTTTTTTKAADTGKAPDLKPREKGDMNPPGMVDHEEARDQAQEDFDAQAQATARAAVSNRLEEPEPGKDGDAKLDLRLNAAGQVVEPEVLEIQERQAEELAEREKAGTERQAEANKQRDANTQK